MDGACWKNPPPPPARASAAMKGVAGLRPVPLSLSVSPTSYCEFTRSRSLVDAIFLGFLRSLWLFGDALPHSLD